MDLSMDGMPVDVNQSILDVESPKRGNPWTIAEWEEAFRIARAATNADLKELRQKFCEPL